MKDILHLAAVLPGLSAAQLGTLIVLGAFALAAFAIYAVFQIAKGPRR